MKERLSRYCVAGKPLFRIDVAKGVLVTLFGQRIPASHYGDAPMRVLATGNSDYPYALLADAWDVGVGHLIFFGKKAYLEFKHPAGMSFARIWRDWIVIQSDWACLGLQLGVRVKRKRLQTRFISLEGPAISSDGKLTREMRFHKELKVGRSTIIKKGRRFVFSGVDLHKKRVQVKVGAQKLWITLEQLFDATNVVRSCAG